MSRVLLFDTTGTAMAFYGSLGVKSSGEKFDRIDTLILFRWWAFVWCCFSFLVGFGVPDGLVELKNRMSCLACFRDLGTAYDFQS